MLETPGILNYSPLFSKIKAVKMFNRCGQSAGKTFRESVGYYLSGFTDGEGSFNISTIRRKDYKNGWKISLSFNVSQKDDTIPKLFKNYLNCGKIRYRRDGICYFEVRKIKDIKEKVIPFFKHFPLLSKKKNVFKIFCQTVKIIYDKNHLDKKGIKSILLLRDKIVVNRKRKFSNELILNSY